MTYATRRRVFPSRRISKFLATAAAALLGASTLVVSAAPAAAAPVATTVTINPNSVVQQDFLGIGVNLIPVSLMPNNRSKGYDEAYWEMDLKRIHTIEPKVARVWFQPDWVETTKGVYDFNSPKMQAFYKYLDGLKAAGTEIELNYGWKVGREIQSWFSIPGVPARISAPADLDAFAAGASALLNHLINVRGYDNVDYLAFYNEPNGWWDFEAPNEAAYYSQMVQKVHDKLIADGRRSLVKIWGPEEWNSVPWTQHMKNTVDHAIDAYSFHVYGGTYGGLSEQFDSRKAVIGDKPLVLSEFGFSGNYDSWWEAGYGNYVIKMANEGVKSGLIWQLNGVWVEDPDEDTDTNDTYTLWDSLLTTSIPNPRYYEAGLLLRYVPEHSDVLTVTTGSEDVRATAFRTASGDYTILVETNENVEGRQLNFNFSGVGINKTFNKFVYTDSVVGDANALLPARSGTFAAGSSFSDATVDGQRNVIIYTTAAPETQVAVTPTNPTINGGQSIQLNAQVIDGSGGVTWSVVGSGNGSITSGGSFTAPNVTEPKRIAIRATSTSNPSSYGVALVQVLPASTATRVDLPSFSIPGATYNGSRTVSITTATSGATIRYTTNGETPTAASSVYMGPLTISGSTVLKAQAFKPGLDPSAIRSELYRILPAADGPAGYTYCSYQDQTCGFPGIATVAFGANGNYITAVFDRRAKCDVTTFGADPAQGTQKRCFYLPSTQTHAIKPTIRPGGGYYEAPQTVSIETTEPGGQIRYTTNGTLPTSSSPLYTGPFTVGSTQTVKAITVKAGVANSPLSVNHYDVIDKTGGPAGYTWCAVEFGTCAFTGTATVAYGANGNFVSATHSGGVQCQAGNFGGADPAPNVQKKCFFQSGGSGLVATPTFSPGGGTYTSPQTVTISTVTSGAQIRYTLDGSTPTTSSTLYSGPVTVPASLTLRAIAVKAGSTNSTVASATYTINTGGGGSDGPAGYTQCANEFGTCHFLGTAQVAFGANGTYNYGTFTSNVQCVASNFGGDPTPGQAKKCYYQGQSTASTPTFSPNGGTFTSAQSVTISSTTSGAQIRYTTDGSTPTASSTLYSSPVSVSATTTLKAIAIASGVANSAVATAVFTINTGGGTPGAPAGYTECAGEFATCTFPGVASVAFGANGAFNFGTFTNSVQCVSGNFGGDPAFNTPKKCYYQLQSVAVTPTFSPNGGTFTSTQSVTIATTTTGAQIRYTTDGSTPTASSTLYSAPVSVNANTTLKAIAIRSGLANSAVASATFVINTGGGGGLPAGYTQCANEFGTCTFSGTKSVAFGAGSSYNFGTFTNSVQCVSGNFGGDPAYNVAKKCYVQP